MKMALQPWFRRAFSSLMGHEENVFKWQLEESSKPKELVFVIWQELFFFFILA